MYLEREFIDAADKAENTEAVGWEACLNLEFLSNGDGKTLLKRRHHGPLTVQRPFYPEGGICHVYLLHPPGGVVAGDRLAIDVEAGAQAEALVTTPAAGKFYRSSGNQALQQVSVRLDVGAVVEWLPQETIVYEGARLISSVDVSLSEDSRFLGWEMMALGRPAAGEEFNEGEVILDWRIVRNRKPLYLEKMRLDAAAFAARWGLNGQSCCGTLFATPASPKHLEMVRRLIGDEPRQGATLIDDLLICRASATQTYEVRQFFDRVRTAIRNGIIRRESYAPRIWAT